MSVRAIRNSCQAIVLYCLARIPACLILGALVIAARASSTGVWSAPPFAALPAALLQEAHSVEIRKDREETILLNDFQFYFDEAGLRNGGIRFTGLRMTKECGEGPRSALDGRHSQTTGFYDADAGREQS